MALPPLPRIDGDVDLMLDVHTHPSLRHPSTPPNPDYGDTTRLAELGSKVLDLAVTYHFLQERPFLDTETRKRRKEEILSPENLDNWLKQYGLKDKLRVAPSDMHILSDLQEMSTYFHVYVGALYIRNGLGLIQTWVSGLINPNLPVKLPSSSVPEHLSQVPASYQPSFGHQYGYAPPNPMASHQNSDGYGTSNMGSPMTGHYSASPPPPSGPPPPLPGNPPVSSPLSLVTLALVNQTASQKGYQVSYQAEQAGPPHQPTWSVRCFLNGTECGRGMGKSQKQAKEEAARQAWATMGWGPT
ncbi:hypothetical protein D9613_002255 [Agrocybe pediades]|uniref:DRBM domain-containing protein n=1 Tax=Agrocybe pediades TaxID=84607 RepID=A0A8H4R3Q1_9AGAR|nr:hypothetical protein D9613_002255 [Agrocybe pediades]